MTPEEIKAFRKIDGDYKKAKSIYGESNIFGIFSFGNNSEVIVIPSFSEVCTNKQWIDTCFWNNGHTVYILDARFLYCAAKEGHPETLHILFTNTVIINPIYEHLYEKYFKDYRKVIGAGTPTGVPSPQLKIAVCKLIRTAMDNNSVILGFLKQLTDADKLALDVITQMIGDEGIIKQNKIASLCGITRQSIKTLIDKMEAAHVAEVKNMGPKGTYVKILDDTLLQIKGGK